LYRNSTTHTPYNLAIPGCDAVCPLEKFAELLKPVIPVSWEKECKMGIFSGDFTFSSLSVMGQYLILYVKSDTYSFFMQFCNLITLDFLTISAQKHVITENSGTHCFILL
jgi:hypothetical protein